MSQTIFDVTTTKGQALTGINANFTEVYGSLTSQAASLASLNDAIALLAPKESPMFTGVVSLSDLEVSGQQALSGTLLIASTTQITFTNGVMTGFQTSG